MAAKNKNPRNIPADKLELYDTLIASHPKIERKGAQNPYTSHNGHMFSYLNAEGSLALRLGDEDREKFLKQHKTTLFEAYGVVMKEYVKVPDTLLRDTKAMKKYLAMSYAHIETLKPKPTTRKKAAKSKKAK